MRRNHIEWSGLFLMVLLAAVGLAAPAQAVTSADFDAGASTYPGSPGDGWANAWQSSAGLSANVTNAAPLDGNTNYLSADGSGAIRLVARQYENFNEVNVSQPHTIMWKYRLDAPDLSQFTVFNDRVNFFARGDAGLGGATSAADSWEILATGAPHGSGAVGTPAQFHVFDSNDGGNGFNPTNIVDTGVPLTPGDVYKFTVNVDPTRQMYDVQIDNETTGQTAVRDRLGFRNTTNPADSFNYLHLGGRTSAGGDNMPFSIDSVNISASNGLDGLVSYGGTAGTGGLQELTGVIVRRDGVETPYAADELIGVTMTHFKGGTNASNLLVPTGTGAVGTRASLLEDLRFDSGVINPGGSNTPLTSDPVIDPNNPGNSTPGFAVMFDRPVVNVAGPDVILFDIQTTSNPAAGDPFHVSPLMGLDDGLNSITIDAYDIQFGDPNAQTVANFDLFAFTGGSPMSLEGLMNDAIAQTGGVRTGFQLLGVAFDLTELGYAEGASVPGLFFQADGTGNVFDPVLIAGLPGGAVPEPATAGLLMCASLALLRRRRAMR